MNGLTEYELHQLKRIRVLAKADLFAAKSGTPTRPFAGIIFISFSPCVHTNLAGAFLG